MQDADYGYEKEREWAEQGFASSQFNLGVRYDLGRGVPQDEKLAAFWYEKAAAQGHWEAKSKLALLATRISDRKAVEGDRKAVEDLKKSAAQGNADSQYELGVRYRRDGPLKDIKQAVFWFEKATEQGLARASDELRHIYSGYGLEKDDEKSHFWRRKAAEQGCAINQLFLGAMYEGGWGRVTQDYENARFWYEKAAEQGISNAQYRLMHIYGNGLGVPQDPDKAEFWRRKAVQTELLFEQKLDQEIARQDAARRHRLTGEISGTGMRVLSAAVRPGAQVDWTQVDWTDSIDDFDAEKWEEYLSGPDDSYFER